MRQEQDVGMVLPSPGVYYLKTRETSVYAILQKPLQRSATVALNFTHLPWVLLYILKEA